MDDICYIFMHILIDAWLNTIYSLEHWEINTIGILGPNVRAKGGMSWKAIRRQP